MKSTDSFWVATSPGSDLPARPLPDAADVVVIGGGITGLTAAVLLASSGKRVLVLEKGRIAAGESGLTTAHLTEAIDARYQKIRRTLGPEAAKAAAEASRAAIEHIEQNVQQYGIECAFHRVPGYLYSENRKDVAPLKNEAVSARDAGVAATWAEDVPLPFPTRGAVRFDQQARFHPRRYLLGLASRIADGIYEETAVTRVEGGVVETTRGRIRASHVVVATHAPINDIAIHTRVTPYRTYAIALELPDGGITDALFWDTADPYHYTRIQETDLGTFLIVGGEDHRVGEERDPENCYQRLETYVRERFGELPVRYRWSGQIIDPADGLPFIGRVSEGVYVATGYAGQGMTFGTAAALLIADLIEGRENAWAATFDPARVGLAGAGQVIAHNIDAMRHLALDKLTDVEGLDTLDIRAGEGKIVVLRGRKVAVSRDGSGALHALSPVCTHLKCDVRWNSVETSWDCPCHGSRYDIDGKVLNGPATEPLERVEVADDDQTGL